MAGSRSRTRTRCRPVDAASRSRCSDGVTQLISEIHGELLKGVQGGDRDRGQFRRTQNWIGPESVIGKVLALASVISRLAVPRQLQEVSKHTQATRSTMMAAIDDPKTLGRARLSFADQHDIDEFLATLETFERGEIGPDRWRAFRLVRGTCGQRQDGDVHMLRVKVPQGVLDLASCTPSRRWPRPIRAALATSPHARTSSSIS